MPRWLWLIAFAILLCGGFLAHSWFADTQRQLQLHAVHSTARPQNRTVETRVKKVQYRNGVSNFTRICSSLVATIPSKSGEGVVKETKRNWWSYNASETLPPLRRCCPRCSELVQVTGFSGVQWVPGVFYKSHRPCRAASQQFPRFVGPNGGIGASPESLQRILESKFIVIIGHSVAMQWFEALVCYLGVPWSGWPGTREVAQHVANQVQESVGVNLAAYTLEPFWPGFANISFPTGGEVRFYFSNPLAMQDKLGLIAYHSEVHRADFIFINEGIHYNAGQERDLHVSLCVAMLFCETWNAPCVFQESPPQHFAKSQDQTGLWEGRADCADIEWASYGARANWRNDAIHAASLVANYSHKLRVHEIFDALMPRGDGHMAMGCGESTSACDGTHYAADAELWEPWHISFWKVLQKNWQH